MQKFHGQFINKIHADNEGIQGDIAKIAMPIIRAVEERERSVRNDVFIAIQSSTPPSEEFDPILGMVPMTTEAECTESEAEKIGLAAMKADGFSYESFEGQRAYTSPQGRVVFHSNGTLEVTTF